MDRRSRLRRHVGAAQHPDLSQRPARRAALAEAVDEGLIARSPAAHVGLPRSVAKPVKEKEALVWDEAQVDRFLEVTAAHRWYVAFRLGVLLGLRRSEVLALRWDDFDPAAKTLRIDESLVPLNNGAALSNAKNERSRRLVPLDDGTLHALKQRRVAQNLERLAAGAEWTDHDLVITTRNGNYVLPRAYDRSLAIVVQRTGLPNLTSHGLRHTAATHMVRSAGDVGELRAIADILGHSPEMLLNVYSHALPRSQSAVVSRISARSV